MVNVGFWCLGCGGEVSFDLVVVGVGFEWLGHGDCCWGHAVVTLSGCAGTVGEAGGCGGGSEAGGCGGKVRLVVKVANLLFTFILC